MEEKMKECFRVMGVVLGLALASVSLFERNLNAQVTATASLQGTIVDKSQAILSGAEVTITNAATGATRMVKTSDTRIPV
jgi:uncharacterized MnhB-related membrane protein